MTTPRFVAWVRRQSRPPAASRRHRGAGQPRGTQGAGRPGADRSRGGYHQIPPALLLRLQSDRAGLGLGQEAHSRRGAPDGRAAAMHGPTGPGASFGHDTVGVGSVMRAIKSTDLWG